MMVGDFQISDFADRVKIRWLPERRGEIRLPMDRLAGKSSMARRHAHKPAQARTMDRSCSLFRRKKMESPNSENKNV
jgi:hypothetical protein